MKDYIRGIASILWGHLVLALGWLLVLGGIVVTPLPIPIGLIMVMTGLSLLTLKSHFFRLRVKTLRGRYRKQSGKLERITPRLPKFIRQALELTEPDKHEP